MGNNEWLDIDVLDDYLEGKLEPSMMHKVERISLEDPFVAQALAGLTEAKKRTQTLSLLQKQLHERIAEKPVERKMWRITSMRLSIAATAAVLFITVSVLFWFRENHRQQQVELAANNKTIEVDLKPEAVAIVPVDTIIQAKPQTLVDQQKVERALSETLTKGSGAIAKNNDRKEVVAESPILQHRELSKARLKKETSDNQATIVGARVAAPAPPVQALESRVDGIQVQTSNAKLVKGIVYDINGRPIPGAEIKMVGDDLRAITNMSGEFTLPTNKDAEKVTLEVASLGFAKKNVEAKANEKLSIRLEESRNMLNEVAVVGYGVQKKEALIGAKNAPLLGNKNKIDSPIIFADRVAVEFTQPENGWKTFDDYLKQNNKLLKTGNKIVSLGFKVKKNGSVSNIKVIKGQTKEMNNEAIRLLKDGPKWKYGEKLVNETVIYIKF